MTPVLPLTYDECRARFRRAAVVAGLPLRVDPIQARGPERPAAHHRLGAAGRRAIRRRASWC